MWQPRGIQLLLCSSSLTLVNGITYGGAIACSCFSVGEVVFVFRMESAWEELVVEACTGYCAVACVYQKFPFKKHKLSTS